MSNFIVCLNSIGPLFIIMLAGSISCRTGLMDRELVPKFNRVIFYTFASVMLFYNTYNVSSISIFNLKYLFFVLVSVLVVFLLGLFYTIKRYDNNRIRGVVIQAIYRSNFGAVGFAIASNILSGDDLGIVSVLVSFVVIEFNILAIISLEMFNGNKIDFKKIIKGLIKNPLIIASAFGILFLALNIKLPFVLEKSASDMAKVGAPVQIFLLGAYLRFDNIKKDFKILMRLCILRLIVVPAFVLSISYLLGYRNAEFVGLLCAFSTSVATNTFIMCEQMGSDGELAGELVAFSNGLCLFTVFLWCYLFKCLGAF